MRHSRVAISLSALLATLATKTASFAASTSGGNGTSVGFVAPMRNFANAFELIGGALVVIAISVIIGQHLLDRDDLGMLAKHAVKIIVCGAILLASGAFLTQVGVATGALIY